MIRLFSILFIILLHISPTVLAQSQGTANNKLALEYFRSGEFEKSAELYTQLFKNTGSRTHFSYLIKSLTELKEYSKAIKVVKQQQKKFPEDLSYYVDLGVLYEKNNQKDKANDQYEKAISKLGASTHQVTELGQRFVQEQKYSFAVKTYHSGQKTFKNQYGFHSELATVYFYLRDYSKMVQEYIALLDESEHFLETVQSRLQSLIVNDIDNSLRGILKHQLIASIQDNPNNIAYQEMIIWLFIQEKDFGSAYIHSSALDKRFKEDGGRLYELGTLALSNNAFDTAIKCFQYNISKGEESPYYVQGREKMLSAKLKKLEQNIGSTSHEDIQILAGEYKETLDEIGLSHRTISIAYNYATVLAFHAHRTDSAISLLEQTLNLPNLKQSDKQEHRMLLADCKLFNDEIWEANLLYAKIEKENSHNPIGHKAKFKRAQIAYYSGDFEYAEAFLDVLKASTSKLISNDAFELAQLINDNIALDTTTKPMELFAQADYLFFKKQDSVAMLMLDSVMTLFPTHSLTDDILFRKANYYTKHQQFDKAEQYFNSIITDYGYDVLADNALFQLATLYEHKLSQIEKAKDYYKRIITEYPSSIYVPEARSRYRKLRGDTIN